MVATIQQTIDELRRTLTEYIEATYHIGHPLLVAQRRRLLATRGGIFQDAYLESTPSYVLGVPYEDMAGIPASAREAFTLLSSRTEGRPLLFNPPYIHQARAIEEVLTHGKNLMIMTGTGSGKTESFLLPILGKLAIEAKERPGAFAQHAALRAIVLYPMNALVNDQLGRLRNLFGHRRVASMFEAWAGRPARFARYTSRTPYAGVRSPNKDSSRLSSIGDFFVAIEDAAKRHESGEPHIAEEDAKAFDVYRKLHARGKWPSKASVSAWFGQPHTPWKDRRGNYKRAVLGPHDPELLTRHEIQQSPPDLLITNYSMLEYMMMRPIERPIFDKTRSWLAACPDEKILIVMDEAHLYRGAQGAEVGLLLRRLRERLGIGPERFQVICATASFSAEGQATAGDFGAQLAGVPADSFVPITGTLKVREPNDTGSEDDAAVLCTVDLTRFYSALGHEQEAAVRGFLDARGVTTVDDLGLALHQALGGYGPFNRLVNETMRRAVPFAELGQLVFPAVDQPRAAAAIDALLAMGSRARLAPGEASLLPCRVHSFFRGLPGLWACMDPHCSELAAHERGGPTGKLYSQSYERCGCGSPVLEYFTCRHCGTSYARAYTDDVTNPQFAWANSGERLQTDTGLIDACQPLDLMLEEPSAPERGVAVTYDLATGRINPPSLSDRSRLVFIRPETGALPEEDDEAHERTKPGEFAPCGCCNKRHTFGRSSVQDHQTKGDQPFQALLAAQIRVQPPGLQPATEFAPLRGRKVLIFSDSRQMAARLAPTLQSYSLKDTVRALLPIGFQILSADPQFGPSLTLDHAFLAVVVAAHRFGIRLRPELDPGETMPIIENAPAGDVPTGADLTLLMSVARCPRYLLGAITDVIQDNGLGIEPLAIASIRESQRLTTRIVGLPALPGLATDESAKLAVARAWLRFWSRAPHIWFSDMPPEWWANKVTTHQGKFKPMDRVLVSRDAKRVFNNEWLPRLLRTFAPQLPDGGSRMLASNLSLDIGGDWRRCLTCKSVHRPIAAVTVCVDCGSGEIEAFDPDTDRVFLARRGFYRDPVIEGMVTGRPGFVSLIAAEHTAQLNAAQPDEAFSNAEKHEIRFQDIDLAWRDTDPPGSAIDVLSSTTTMEVGIDIGELSGVALRNMPPGRANYQQRAGRAGRRGTSVATVIAFGSADSHDDHYFVRPDEMIRGPVADPRLTLENPDIARRHLRAYLLQRYHEARLPEYDTGGDPNLFSVLGRVRDFVGETSILNRHDLRRWLAEHDAELRASADRWLPHELSAADRDELIENMAADLADAVDKAIKFVEPTNGSASPPVAAAEAPSGEEATVETQADDEEPVDGGQEAGDSDFVDPAADKLLNRLLYWGVLPRYAFPTDVAPFYVFNRTLSTAFRPVMDFAPTQGLNIALSQYAPNKQIWIRGKQYTSKAIYSPFKNERRDAWGRRKLYFECTRCGHATTDDYSGPQRGARLDCVACGGAGTFGPGRAWLRPPGFAHPIDKVPGSTPDAANETAYATRAKLKMSTPAPETGWLAIGSNIRAYPTRELLLVSNSGPEGDGYHYCVACGRIEAASDQETNLFQPHDRPYRGDEDGQCPGVVAAHIVLGTDFQTDITLLSFRLGEPFCLRPGNEVTASALRTVSEALAKAAGLILQIEPGEVLAEFRPALTVDGSVGLEVEVFMYDTLAGGAGFSSQLAERGTQLLRKALEILEWCPEGCDSSCYRCLRNFRNKLDHHLLDRKLGSQLLRHALYGGYPAFDTNRAQASLRILFDDLRRQMSERLTLEWQAQRTTSTGIDASVPIIATRHDSGAEFWIALSSPLAAQVPVDAALQGLPNTDSARLVCVDDMLIRRNLPAAVDAVRARMAV